MTTANKIVEPVMLQLLTQPRTFRQAIGRNSMGAYPLGLLSRPTRTSKPAAAVRLADALAYQLQIEVVLGELTNPLPAALFQVQERRGPAPATNSQHTTRDELARNPVPIGVVTGSTPTRSPLDSTSNDNAEQPLTVLPVVCSLVRRAVASPTVDTHTGSGLYSLGIQRALPRPWV